MNEVIAFPTPVAVDPASLWPDPVPLPSTLLPVEAFDEQLLPTDFRRWAVDIAERMNVPLDFAAVPAMVAASSLIGRRVGIRPEVHTDWTEAANFWGCIIGPPGAMKSPAVRQAFTAPHALERRAADAYEVDLADFKLEQMLYELEKKQANNEVTARLKSAEEDRDSARFDALNILRAMQEPVAPPQVRYVTNDATPEKLGELCRDNPNGLLLHRDELLTMFTDLDQEEKASGRGFLMGGWTGLDGHVVDRIGRGTIRIPAVNLSVFGTAQPNRIVDYMRNSLRTHDDGFVQRVQLLAWPDFSETWRSGDRRIDDTAKNAAIASFERVSRIDAYSAEAECDNDHPGAVPFVRFGGAAQEAFNLWRPKLENKIRDPALSPALASHLAKYRGLVPRLALVCHLTSGGIGSVPIDAWVMAEWWASYLESHARRAYAAIETSSTDTARAILSRIKKGDLSHEFTSRDVYRKGWTGLKDREIVEKALAYLADYDWLAAERSNALGRPTTVWTVNPKALTMI